MPDLRVRQILDAQAARVAGIAGIGDNGIGPKPAATITGFPACFLTAARMELVERTMGGNGGSQTARLRTTWTGIYKGVDAYLGIFALGQSIEQVVMAAPFALGLTTAAGVHRVITESVNYPPVIEPQANDYAVVEVTFVTLFNRQFGVA